MRRLILLGIFLDLVPPKSVVSQLPVTKVNKKYDVWQINRLNLNWPDSKKDFRPQLFYLFFSKYKKRNHNNWRQYVPIGITTNQIVRPQVEEFRDSVASMLEKRTLDYAYQKISFGWHFHYRKLIKHKRSQVAKEIKLLNRKGGSIKYPSAELERINQYVDGIRNSLMQDIEKQKSYVQALGDYKRLLSAIEARRNLIDLKDETLSIFGKDRPKTYLNSAQLFQQKMEKIQW